MYASSSDTFYKYYSQGQRGGALGSVDGIPVFTASRRRGQGGAGLGDMLRSAFRWFLPVAMRGASTFANQFLKSHDQGATFRDAAKSAIGPALGVAGDAIRSRIQARAKQQDAANDNKQAGSGLKRRRRRVYKGKAKRRKVGTAKRKQLGLGRRAKPKKQRGGKKRKQQRGGKKRRKTTKRHRRRTVAPTAASYNF